MTRLRSLLLLLLLAGTASCASPPAFPRPPSRGGAPWVEITTEHFIVKTDLDEDDARAAATKFETAFSQLQAAAFPGTAATLPRMTIIELRDEREFHGMFPADQGGFYADRTAGDFERTPTLVVYALDYASYDWYARELFLHELTHRLIAFSYGWMPVWLNEGLAQYYSTLAIDDGEVSLGAPPTGASVTAGLTPTVHALLSVDRATFYGSDWRQDQSGRDDRHRYYSGAWALTHFFLNGPDVERAAFQAFVHRMNHGDRMEDAWGSTIGRIPAADLERDFAAYVTAWRWNLLVRPIAPRPIAGMGAPRRLDEGETHVLFARLALDSRTMKGQVGAELDAASAGSPGSTDIAYARAGFELSQGHAGVARELLVAAVRSAPDDPRYLYALCRASGGVAASDGVTDVVDRLAVTAKTSDELAAVAEAEDLRGDHDAAVRIADRAVALDPGYYAALAVRANALFQAGRLAEAVRDQTRAVALIPEQVVAPFLIERLAVYRAALAAHPEDAPVAAGATPAPKP